MRRPVLRRVLSGAVLLVPFLAVPAGAVPVTVTVSDTAPCDVLVALPTGIHELGLGGSFPPGERILSGFTFPTAAVCAGAVDDPMIPNMLVSITNMTGVRWREVHYVSDPESTMTNVDGLINGEEAFRIDTIGVNKPLFSESGAANGLFEPGETWEFVIQDYTDTLFRSPALFVSVGLVGADSTGMDVSTGSIIALQVDPLGVPAPSTALLVISGGAILVAARRLDRSHRTRRTEVNGRPTESPRSAAVSGAPTRAGVVRGDDLGLTRGLSGRLQRSESRHPLCAPPQIRLQEDREKGKGPLCFTLPEAACE